MSGRNNTTKMVSKSSKGLHSCSTPEPGGESPSRDSDSLSEAASPVPFLCTQDGAEGENDVVWNFYTPKSGRTTNTRLKNSTPLSRKSKRTLRSKLIEKPLPKRRNLRNTQKNTQLFQDLVELNQNLHELIPKKPQNCTERQHSGSEDDVFGISPECSPKGTRRLSSNCLRKNVLSSNFNKPETEYVLESDDSMNECLIKASQIVEDIIMDENPLLPKRPCYEHHRSNIKQNNSTSKFKINHDSMDIILGNIKLESPRINNVKKCASPHLKDDSFDSMFGNLNESVFEQLTQMPVKLDVTNKNTDSKAVDVSPMSISFGRHNSMPESPSLVDNNKPSTSGMVFGRYNTMPYDNQAGNSTVVGDSPIRCTPDEIKRKHQLAREKLLAKRLLPFTSSQCNASQKNVQNTQNNVQRNIMTTQTSASTTIKNAKFQPRVPSSAVISSRISQQNKNKPEVKTSNTTELKVLLEQKRQEALMRLRRRQQQNKVL